MLSISSFLSSKSVTGYLLKAAAISLLSLVGIIAHADVPHVTYPPIKLRGFGTLSGSYAYPQIDGQTVSMLSITCEDEAKAKLVQAKYLSDLQVLPGTKAVNISVGQASLPGFQTAGGSAILAARHDRIVEILITPTTKLMSNLVEGHFGKTLGSVLFSSDEKVPMYLNRFDKYGFRFYYGPYTTPQKAGVKTKMVVDPVDDFAFAQKSNHAGMVFWHGPFAVDGGEGLTNLNWWDWALRAAAKSELPVGINDGQDRASWAYNRYPDQMLQFQPGFLGDWYGSMNFGENILSWNAFDAKDQVLAEVQESLRGLTKYDNITSWLEPHEEMGHGIANLFVDYGPVADQGYRKFLKEQYGDVGAVSRRWYGNDTTLKSWDDVKVPEIASFLGWGPDAIDLTGLWRICYDVPFAEAGSTKLDDSMWPTVSAPNHAIARFLPRKPAVFRRHITVDPAWRKAHDKVWLYVWDLNDVRSGDKNPQGNVMVFVNGKLQRELPRKVTQDHWVALDVSKDLVAGDNQIAITLPKGMFNYRVYLSPHEPVLYPNLGTGRNAQWVDFRDWNTWTRVAAVRRGSQMIRQVDPIRGIMLMSPDYYLDGISQVAKDYGGDLHNTGYMGGFWDDYLPAVSRSYGLPITVEPGSPSRHVPDFKAAFGRWLSEGANAIDYFQHEGDIFWDEPIRKCFEEHLPLYSSIGKYHPPTAEVATLYSGRNDDLPSFPWSGGLGYGATNPAHLGSGYYRWNVRAVLRGAYESDALVESSFARGDAARYKVVIDTNTSMIDDKLLGDIEAYVRNGGTFVTFVQTGRHSTTEMDTWPIEKLTGYHVTSLNQPQPWKTEQLRWAKDQEIFSGDWMNHAESDGLSLKKVADDVTDLAYWKDGSVAIGMRPLGKGTIIEIGCRFTSWGLPDRVDEDIREYLATTYGKDHEYGLPSSSGQNLMTPELRATETMFAQILKSRGISEIPAQVEPSDANALLRHYVSNNGLYDVWLTWNQSKTSSVATNILFKKLKPAWAINLLDGSRIEVKDDKLPLKLEPFETAIYLTPRENIVSASQQWFELQRNWWQGTADPGQPLPHLEPKLAVDLTQDWAFHPLEDLTADISALVDPKADDSSWPRREIGVFTLPDNPGLHRALFRKTFTVPATWDHGRVGLWLQSWDRSMFVGKGRIYFDGKLIKDASENGLVGEEIGGALKAGTTHQLAVEISGPDSLVGARGPVWITYHPEPVVRQDLAGDWQTSSDGLTYDAPVHLPGPAKLISRRQVKIDDTQSARTVVVHAIADNGLKGVIINGHWVSRFHHNIGSEINLNVTPWVKFGQDNEIMLIGSGAGAAKELSLEFHEKGTYP